MGWERLKHPVRSGLRVDDRIEVMILNVDKERGKIAWA
jgi:small subunit ribosomal protein S1